MKFFPFELMILFCSRLTLTNILNLMYILVSTQNNLGFELHEPNYCGRTANDYCKWILLKTIYWMTYYVGVILFKQSLSVHSPSAFTQLIALCISLLGYFKIWDENLNTWNLVLFWSQNIRFNSRILAASQTLKGL